MDVAVSICFFRRESLIHSHLFSEKSGMYLPNRVGAKGCVFFCWKPEKNLGRGNIFTINGVTIMVDFAYNLYTLNAAVVTPLQYPA